MRNPNKPYRGRQITSADKVIAFKALCLIPDLTGSERIVFGFLIDSYNKFNGRCDPSIGTIAQRTGLHVSTVKRAIKKLSNPEGGRPAFLKVVYQGGSHCQNAYEPMWDVFRQFVEDWDQQGRRKRRDKPQSEVAHTPPDQYHIRSQTGGRNDTQTHGTNPLNQPIGDEGQEDSTQPSQKEERSNGLGRGKTKGLLAQFTGTRPFSTKSPSHKDVALNKASERLERDLRNLQPEVYEKVCAEIDPEEWDIAVNSEMNRKGSGLGCLQELLRIGKRQRGN